MIPTGYDAITLNHWLWFKYQCHENSPTDFQPRFENVIKRARPEFIADPAVRQHRRPQV